MKPAQYNKARHEHLLRTEMAARSVLAGQFDWVERPTPPVNRSLIAELTAQFMQSRLVRQALGAAGMTS